jgi:hypothetical protein
MLLGGKSEILFVFGVIVELYGITSAKTEIKWHSFSALKKNRDQHVVGRANARVKFKYLLVQTVCRLPSGINSIP